MTYLKIMAIVAFIGSVLFLQLQLKQKAVLEDKLQAAQTELKILNDELLNVHRALDDASRKMAYQNGLLLSYEEKFQEIIHKQNNRNKSFSTLRKTDELVEEWASTELPFSIKRLLNSADEFNELYDSKLMPENQSVSEPIQ